MGNNIRYKVKQCMCEDWKYDMDAARSSSGESAEKWVEDNRQLLSRHRDSLETVREVYDHAYAFLCEMLGENNISLPVDVRKLAEACDFTVSIEDFSSLKTPGDRRFPPVAQLQMRRRMGKGEGNITGTIRIADYLGEKSVLFSIAHELGHYVLREHSPIGLNFQYEMCPGLYPLCSTDELLTDLFAYALLLPYPLFIELKDEYEKDNTRWPVDFSDWIAFLRDKTQMPEYHAVLAYQYIKKYDLAQKLHKARENTPEWMKKLIQNLLQKQRLSKREIVSILQFEESKGEYSDIQSRLPETVEWVQDETIEELWREKYKDSGTGTEKEQNENKDGPRQEKVTDREKSIFDKCPENYKNKILTDLYFLGMSEKQILDITGIEEKELLDLVSTYENNEEQL